MKNNRYKIIGNSPFSNSCSLPTNSGFTLIELVVVVSIIVVLSGISLFALNNARISGRDAKRKGDLEEIKSGLELFKADCNYYPDSGDFPAAGNSFTGSACGLGGNNYLQAVPGDPSGGNYLYVPSGCSANGCTSYKLWVHLEADPPPTSPTYCGAQTGCFGGTCNYCVTNP